MKSVRQTGACHGDSILSVEVKIKNLVIKCSCCVNECSCGEHEHRGAEWCGDCDKMQEF
jgi:hypothetical protein